MESKSVRDRADARVAARLDARLVEQLTTSGGRARPGARIATFLVATAVHLCAAAFLASGLDLVVVGDNAVQRLIGAVLLLPTTVLLLPRRDRESLERVDPDQAPRFTALVRQVAEALGTPPPTVVGVDEDINAYATERGVRERRMVIGAPLWAALTPQGRLALLAHELAHFSHHDVVHGRYVWWARRTLGLWIDLVTPDGLISTEGRTPVFATVATAPLRMPLAGLDALLTGVSAAASRHDELVADTAAAAIAGTAAAIEVLETLLLVDVIDVAANRAAVDPARPDLAQEIRSRVATVSPASRRIVTERAGAHRVDATHPRTVDRLRLQEALPPARASIVLDADEGDAIDAELRPWTRVALKRMADEYRHVW